MEALFTGHDTFLFCSGLLNSSDWWTCVLKKLTKKGKDASLNKLSVLSARCFIQKKNKRRRKIYSSSSKLAHLISPHFNLWSVQTYWLINAVQTADLTQIWGIIWSHGFLFFGCSGFLFHVHVSFFPVLFWVDPVLSFFTRLSFVIYSPVYILLFFRCFFSVSPSIYQPVLLFYSCFSCPAPAALLVLVI